MKGFVITMLCVVALGIGVLVDSSSPKSFADTGARVVHVDQRRSHTEHRGGLSLTWEESERVRVALPSGRQADIEMRWRSSRCVEGQEAIAFVQVGRFTGYLYDVITVNCDAHAERPNAR